MNWKNWGGWAALGAIFMMVVGVFQVITGIWGLFNDQWIVQGYNGYFVVDVTGLAVWYIVIGALLLLGGLYVVRGARWARVIGVIAVSLAFISQLFMLPVHPIWSLVLLFIYVMALIGFVVMKEPLEAQGEIVEAAPQQPQAAPPVAEPVAPVAEQPVAPPLEEPVAPVVEPVAPAPVPAPEPPTQPQA
jgi:hypothetical protein